MNDYIPDDYHPLTALADSINDLSPINQKIIVDMLIKYTFDQAFNHGNNEVQIMLLFQSLISHFNKEHILETL